MARIKGATMTHKRRKKMLKLAKGFYGSKSKHFKMAKQQGHEERQLRSGRPPHEEAPVPQPVDLPHQ